VSFIDVDVGKSGGGKEVGSGIVKGMFFDQPGSLIRAHAGEKKGGWGSNASSINKRDIDSLLLEQVDKWLTIVRSNRVDCEEMTTQSQARSEERNDCGVIAKHALDTSYDCSFSWKRYARHR
jgi:hypothetical protein